MENKALMKKGRDALKGKWGIAIATFLVYNIMMSGANLFHDAGGIVALILAGPLGVGAAIFSLTIARGGEPQFEQLFEGFKNFTNALLTFLLMLLYILLWSLLLIIPGIIAAFSYSMTFYILAEDPHLKPKEALQKSKELMDGYKLKLFYLYLRYFLLALLCLLTLGIGFLWLIPYVNVTNALFYEDIKTVKSDFV